MYTDNNDVDDDDDIDNDNERKRDEKRESEIENTRIHIRTQAVRCCYKHILYCVDETGWTTFFFPLCFDIFCSNCCI